MKSRLFVVVDQNGELIAASFAFPDGSGLPYARPEPTKPGHTLHELDVPHEMAINPTFESLQTTVNNYLRQQCNAKNSEYSANTCNQKTNEPADVLRPLESTKPAFSIRSFHEVVKAWNQSFPDMKKTPWQDLIRSSFELTPEQERSFEVSPHLSRATQSVFQLIQHHLKSGGRIASRIELCEKQRRNAVLTLTSADGNTTELRIVCCMADCTDWEWWN